MTALIFECKCCSTFIAVKKNNMSQIKLFLIAISFYTRLPVSNRLDYNLLPQASICLPLIGWLIGSITALSFYLSQFIFTPSTAIIVSLCVSVLLTGALHEDGFADVCDGFGGGYEKRGILKIMKDSNTGVFGLIGLFLLFSLKISILISFPAAVIPVILIVAHSLSRLTPLLLMYRYDYARDINSKSQLAVYKPNKRELCFATIMALMPLWLLPEICLLIVIPVLVVNRLLGNFFYRCIGGYTGDCLGASQQIAEVVIYSGFGAIWKFI